MYSALQNNIEINEGIYYDKYNNKFQLIKEGGFLIFPQTMKCYYKKQNIFNNRYKMYHFHFLEYRTKYDLDQLHKFSYHFALICSEIQL